MGARLRCPSKESFIEALGVSSEEATKNMMAIQPHVQLVLDSIDKYLVQKKIEDIL